MLINYKYFSVYIIFPEDSYSYGNYNVPLHHMQPFGV